MKQNIMGKLNRLFSGITDSIKVTYYTSKSKDIVKFEMLEHEIAEENGTIRIVDGADTRFFTPKTVIIDSANVDSVTYESDKTNDTGIHCRSLVINLKDQGMIELETVAFG